MITDRTRTVLVIEDNWLNREMLCSILEPYYMVIPAQDGQEGLELLLANKSKISLILLDIEMPVMDGYQFLENIRGMEEFANLPIIVTTSSNSTADEIKCLDKGAADFVSKPYNNDVVLKRVESKIRLREASAIISKAENDSLTGFYNEEFFYIYAERLLQQEEGEFDVFSTDVRAFKMFTERYGSITGNELVLCIRDVIAKAFDREEKVVFGKAGNDRFLVLCPGRDKGFYRELSSKISAAIRKANVPEAGVMMGFCRNVDHDTPAESICENAAMAINTIRDRYDVSIAEYDDNMRKKAIRQQMILDRTEDAMRENQFRVFYQMKYSFERGKIGGAEALVRWNDEKLGFMSPGEFVPLFERSGLITKLDYYLLAHVCADIRRWMAEGRDIVPISVNISRIDFLDPQLVQSIITIVEGYGVPREYIHLEATESAYIENIGGFLDDLNALQEEGFKIELDDFGSGYSSLAILNDLNVDVLKLDMSLIRAMNSPKQKIILKHIFSIADNLELDVVAEGVETQEQADELREMGCTYAQGYYYSKPVPKEEFEEFI